MKNSRSSPRMSTKKNKETTWKTLQNQSHQKRQQERKKKKILE